MWGWGSFVRVGFQCSGCIGLMQHVRLAETRDTPQPTGRGAPSNEWSAPEFGSLTHARNNELGSCGPKPQKGASDMGNPKFRGAEVPEPNGPRGRAAEPSTGTGRAFSLVSVTVGITRDSEPLLLSTARTEPRSRTRSELSHGGRLPRSGGCPRRHARCCQLLSGTCRGVSAGVRVVVEL